jgi:tetratricopeptide (TPR) repeat protein
MIMKNIYKYTFVLIISAIFVGCDDELGIEPRENISGEVALSNQQNLQALLLGIYDESGQADSYGGELQIAIDLIGTDDEVTWFGTFTQPREYINKRILVDNVFVSGTWANAYESINQANLILDNLDVVTDSDVAVYLEGQAKFLRALNYFDLVRLWGQQYNPGGNNTQLGVPLRLVGIQVFSGDLSAPRATVQAIYDQVLLDLEDAYTLLEPNNGIFADKYSAQALRARVYLQQGDFANARDAANDVIVNSGHSLTNTFADAFNNDADSNESVFAFQNTNQTGSNQFITFYASEGNGGRGGDIAINPEYVNLFTDVNDVRGNFFVPSDFGDLLSAKYTSQFANIELFRLAEMFLIRAEGNLESNTAIGDTPAGDLNTLRTRASAGPVQLPITTESILLERQYELAFEGFLLMDLKRTGSAIGTIPANADRLLLPIPQTEMDTNSLIEQNPGYTN